MERKFKTGDVVVRLASDTEENAPMTVRGYVYDIEIAKPQNALCSDFGAPKNKVCHCFYCFPIYLP